jgi:hypothetical protein
MKHCLLTGVTLMAMLGLGLPVAQAGIIPDRATLDALLGGNQILEDFESFDVAYGGAVNLDVFSLDWQTIANGQGPGLVEAGATYLDPSQVHLQWNGDQYYGLNSKTLLANGTAGAIEILYDSPMDAMGVDLRAYEGFGYDGYFDVYDADGSLVGSTPFTLKDGGAENVFLGWQEAGGISRVVLHSSTYAWSPLIDNHGYGLIPAPGALAALGLFGLVGSRRRRSA